MFVKKIPFLISLGKIMKFTIIRNVVDWKAANLLKALGSIKSVYTDKNLYKKILMDNNFEVLQEDLQEE